MHTSHLHAREVYPWNKISHFSVVSNLKHIGPSHILANHFTILELPNTSIGKIYVVQKRQSKDIEALKFGNVP